MKRLSTIFILLLSLTLNAQQFRYGFSIAPAQNWLTLEGDLYNPAVKFSGFQYGLLFDQTIGEGEHFALTAGLNLNYTESGMSAENTPPKGDDKEWGVRAEYIEIPLTLRIRTGQLGKFIFYGEGGASYGNCIRARGDYTANGIRHDTDMDYLTKDNPNGIDYLKPNASLNMGFGTEFSVTETASVLIGFFYEKGLMDVYKDNEEKYNILLNQAGIRIAGLF